MSVAGLLLVTGCGGGILQGAASQADDIGRLARSRWIPPRIAPRVNPAQIPKQSVTAAAAALARPVDDVPTEDAWPIAKGACEATELIEAGQSWENASNYLMGKSPALKYRVQAQGLLKNLAEADTSTDVFVILGKVAICEAADRKG